MAQVPRTAEKYSVDKDCHLLEHGMTINGDACNLWHQKEETLQTRTSWGLESLTENKDVETHMTSFLN